MWDFVVITFKPVYLKYSLTSLLSWMVSLNFEITVLWKWSFPANKNHQHEQVFNQSVYCFCCTKEITKVLLLLKLLPWIYWMIEHKNTTSMVHLISYRSICLISLCVLFYSLLQMVVYCKHFCWYSVNLICFVWLTIKLNEVYLYNM